jgi:hypothetical protein
MLSKVCMEDAVRLSADRAEFVKELSLQFPLSSGIPEGEIISPETPSLPAKAVAASAPSS